LKPLGQSNFSTARISPSVPSWIRSRSLGLIPSERDAKVVEASVTWNYTTVLNIIFVALAASLLWRYFRRGGGLRMLKMMNAPMAHEHAHGHGRA
jgi:hypothetical protein